MHDHWQREAQRLVDGNRERFPGLLVEQLANALRSEARALSAGSYARDMCVVALRMLKDAGKLKPRTDDERAAIELAGHQINAPGGNRAVGHLGNPERPFAAQEYIANVTATGQVVLFGGPGGQTDIFELGA